VRRDGAVRNAPFGRRKETRQAATGRLVTDVVNAWLADRAARVGAAVKDSERLRADAEETRDRLRAEIRERNGHIRELEASLADVANRGISDYQRGYQAGATAETSRTTPAPAAPDVPAEGARSAADGTEPPGEGPAKAALPRRRRTAPKPAKEPAGDE